MICVQGRLYLKNQKPPSVFNHWLAQAGAFGVRLIGGALFVPVDELLAAGVGFELSGISDQELAAVFGENA